MYKKSVVPQTSDLLEKFALIFSLQLSLRTQFTKIDNKKLALKINVKTMKKASLDKFVD